MVLCWAMMVPMVGYDGPVLGYDGPMMGYDGPMRAECLGPRAEGQRPRAGPGLGRPDEVQGKVEGWRLKTVGIRPRPCRCREPPTGIGVLELVVGQGWRITSCKTCLFVFPLFSTAVVPQIKFNVPNRDGSFAKKLV